MMTRAEWKNQIIYQIYPRSFKDSNNDGIGDIQGIIEKLDYLSDLGIDMVWITPIFKSPNKDNGYDVSDYYNIHNTFGTMTDFEKLIKLASKRGIGIMLDMVFNHTSDQHEWFQKSLLGIKPYDDFYIWKKGNNGLPPTEGTAFFGGSVWEYSSQ